MKLVLAILLFAAPALADGCFTMTTQDIFGNQTSVFTANPGEFFEVYVSLENVCDHPITVVADMQGTSIDLWPYLASQDFCGCLPNGTFQPGEITSGYFGLWQWSSEIQPGFSIQTDLRLSWAGEDYGSVSVPVTFQATPVPEPSGLLLFVTGGLLILRRKSEGLYQRMLRWPARRS